MIEIVNVSPLSAFQSSNVAVVITVPSATFACAVLLKSCEPSVFVCEAIPIAVPFPNVTSTVPN